MGYFSFHKRKGVLARLLMKGSANPKAQVSMCTYLGMYRRMRMCAPANINVNVNDTGAHGPPRAVRGDLSSCEREKADIQEARNRIKEARGLAMGARDRLSDQKGHPPQVDQKIHFV